MEKVKSELLLKTVCLYLVYFLYTYYQGNICSWFPMIDGQVIKMILDIIFLLFMVFIYRSVLKEKYQDIKKNYSVSKLIMTVVFGFLGIIVANVFSSFLINILFPNSTIDQNTMAIQNMANINFVYTAFKTMCFSIVAEELLFRESLSKCVDNNILFVLISAIVYTAMNFVFTTESIDFIQLLAYFLPALVFSTIYIKTERNIIIVMLVKFVYNLIPFTILLLGL